MAKFILKRELKIDTILKKIIIRSFHYSLAQTWHGNMR